MESFTSIYDNVHLPRQDERSGTKGGNDRFTYHFVSTICLIRINETK